MVTINMSTEYAHIKHINNRWKTQSIKEHCEGTAAIAEKIASGFGAANGQSCADYGMI